MESLDGKSTVSAQRRTFTQVLQSCRLHLSRVCAALAPGDMLGGAPVGSVGIVDGGRPVDVARVRTAAAGMLVQIVRR